MTTRHRPSTLPVCWLMTDERLGRDLWPAVARLPRGAGIVFRHHATPPGERRRLFARLRRIAALRRLVLIRAGAAPFAGEAGAHNTAARRGGLATASAHDLAEARRKVRAGAQIVFVSPVFETRSHPRARPLGAARAVAIARAALVPAIALGGMDARRFAWLRGFHGWAGIDAWRSSRTAGQKRKAVPT